MATTGTAGSDYLTLYLAYGVTSGRYVLDGKGNSDYLYVTYAAPEGSGDYLTGVTLIGGSGGDRLEGRSVAGTVLAGAGGDRIDWFDAPVTIDSGAGDDGIFYTGASMTFTVIAGTGDDFVIAYDPGGSATVDMGAGDDWGRMTVGYANVRLGTGNDRMEIEQTAGAVVDAGVGDDFVRVNGLGAAIITTGAGNDRIFTGSASGRIDAGSGLDRVYVETGVHTVTLGSAPDILYMRGGVADVLDFRTGNSGDTLVLEDIFTQFGPLPVARDQLVSLGYLSLSQDGADTVVQADLDGAAGDAFGWQEYVRLQDVQLTNLNAHNLDWLPI